jgi:hypothetical protein
MVASDLSCRVVTYLDTVATCIVAFGLRCRVRFEFEMAAPPADAAAAGGDARRRRGRPRRALRGRDLARPHRVILPSVWAAVTESSLRSLSIRWNFAILVGFWADVSESFSTIRAWSRSRPRTWKGCWRWDSCGGSCGSGRGGESSGLLIEAPWCPLTL